MSRRKKWIIGGGLLLLVVGALFLFLPPREPSYNGRPVSAWLRDMDSADYKAKQQAMAAIKAMGPAAVPYLSGALEQRNSTLLKIYRRNLIPKKVVDKLRGRLKLHAPVMESYNAALALSAIGPSADAAIPGLVNALHDSSPLVASAALQALSSIGAQAVPALQKDLEEQPLSNVVWTIRALGGVGSAAAPAAPKLATFLEITNFTGDFAESALRQIGPGAIPAVTNLIFHTNVLMRRHVARFFSDVPATVEATNILFIGANDSDARVRADMWRGIYRYNSDFAFLRPIWVRGLADPAPENTALALSFLSLDQVGVRQHLPEITVLATNTNPGVANIASNLLTMFNAWPKKRAASDLPATAQ